MPGRRGPAAHLPVATDRAVRLQVVETACASGASPAGRILAPQLAYQPDRILVILPIQRRPGPQDCIGNNLYPYTLQLAEPLGSRPLSDASHYPARLVEVPRIP